MKNQLKVFAVMVMAIFMVSTVWAQQGRGQGKGKGMRGGAGYGVCENLPDITDAQKEKIQKLRIDQQKTMLAAHNQMGELRAKLRTLETADKSDISAINNLIDQMGKLRTEMHKTRAAHKQEIRKLLTDEQRLVFDTHQGRRGKGKMHRGQGKCGQGRQGAGRMHRNWNN